MTAPLTANPSVLWLSLVAAAALLGGLLALLPTFLLLASLTGLLGINPTMELSLLALPTAAVGLFFVVVGLAISADLRLQRPVLRIDADGVVDRRISDTPIGWGEVVEGELAPGGGAVQLALRTPRETRVSPYRAGTLGVRETPPGLALIPIRGMDRPAREIATALLAGVPAKETSPEGTA